MVMSNIKAVVVALAPGAAEAVAKRAANLGNMEWNGAARTIRYTRNILYCGSALAAIAMTAANSSKESPAMQYACTAITFAGTCLATVAAKKLYDATALLQRAVNASYRPSDPK